MKYLMFASGVAVAAFALTVFAPFPYWPTYRLLWNQVLKINDRRIPNSAKLKQARFLLKYAILTPVWTFLWYLDEILYPEYRDAIIHPVFIIGQPRSGTTLLHRALATDSDSFFAIRHIEWRYPFISLQKLLKSTGFAPRFFKANYWPDTNIGRRAAHMHPNTMADWEEDGIFFEERFLQHFFLFLRFPYPELLNRIDEFQELPERVRKRILVTHSQVVKKVAYLRNRSHAYYLSKEVTSHSKIPDLLQMYPDARFIVMVRESSKCMISLLALMRASTNAKIGVDPLTIPGWYETFIERMRCDSERLADLCRTRITRDHLVPVSCAYFTSHIRATVEAIYFALDLKASTAFLSYLDELDARQTKREKGYSYPPLKLSDFDGFDDFVRQIEQEFFDLLRAVEASADLQH